jgi:hypothetical protein
MDYVVFYHMEKIWIPDRARRKPISISLDSLVLERIDAVATRQECSRSFAVETLILYGFDRVAEIRREAEGADNGD